MSLGLRHVFSWLHLSDLHFGHGDESYGWNQKTVFDLLSRDVEKALKEWPELPRPDAIMVTGDIAFSGNLRSAAEYAAAETFLSGLLKLLQLPRERVFMVPGNHDVQRDVAKALVARVRAGAGELDAILNEPASAAELLARQANYKKFADSFAERKLEGWLETISVPAFGPIDVLGVNTALVSNDDEDKGKLVLAEGQRHLVSAATSQFRILLSHHPFDSGWLKDEASLQSLAQQQVTVHLCGHVHDPRVNLVSQEGGTNHVRVVAAAAHRDPKEPKARKESHGYNFGSLLVDPRGSVQLRTWPRRWFPKWSGFRVDSMGVPDRCFHDDKPLGLQKEGSGLVLDGPDRVGLNGVHWWGENEIRWNELLYGKKTLEIFGIALGDLLTRNEGHVKALLQRGGTVQALLADPRSKVGMARYDEDFNKPLGDRSKKVYDSLKQLKTLWSGIGGGDRMQIRLTTNTFKYSAYRIDGDLLFVPYRLVPGRKPVDTPAFVFQSRSTVIKRCIGPDLDALRDSAQPLTMTALDAILASGGP